MTGGLRKEVQQWRFLDSWEGCLPWLNEKHVVVISNLKVCRHAADMVCVQEAFYVVGGFKDIKSSSRELSVEVFQLGACKWKSKSTIPTNFENENPEDQKKKINHKACVAAIHKSLLEKLCKL